MGMAKTCKRENRNQRKFEGSETKHFIRSHDKNAENSIVWTHYKDTSILGGRYNARIIAGARKKGSPYA